MEPATNTEAPDGRGLSFLAQIGLLAGPFLSMVDSSVVTVALPEIARGLSSTLAGAQWVVSGYLLALAAVLGFSAFLAKRYGTRRVYLASLLGFTAASAMCALAPDIGFLIAARALQGSLGAPLVPLAMSMLLGKGGAGREMPATSGLLLFLAPAVGPALGGVLVEAFGWPSIFLVNVPLGLLGGFAVLRAVRDPGGGDRNVRPDLVGVLLLAGGLALATYGASGGPDLGWFAADVWPFWAAGGCLLGLYALWALRREQPAVDLRLLRHPQSALAISLCVLVSVVLFFVVFLLPVFMQDVQGFSAFEAGVVLLPQGIVTGVGTILGDMLTRRYGVRRTVVPGMGILTAGTAALLMVGYGTPVWLTATVLSVRGLALGLTIQPLLAATIGDLDTREIADGNALFNVAERLGGSAGIALLATFFQVRERLHIEGALRGVGAAGTGGRRVGMGGLGALPAGVRGRLAEAATSGFHDTVWVLVAVCALGLCAATLLGGKARPAGD
ncbi:DHA2 family efflux MFS transporter permease subunit [Rubrobacter calidifluminis]|uniref:DHA2 family efflux MFS transporter permease subunit n=1 Tax=Rubrobacter calidifluminis TaxID=1392640 RepID=UPI00235FD896|nr:DHA2 family efflux MFS transporter permease subunit [Rubrobacter calidifluminis]